MRCLNCGTENRDDVSRCSGCGLPTYSDTDAPGWKPPQTEEEYVDMWWYGLFGTPPGAFGSLLKAIVLIGVAVLVFALFAFGYVVLAARPQSWTWYIVAFFVIAAALLIVYGLVSSYLHDRARQRASDAEFMKLLSGKRGGPQ